MPTPTPAPAGQPVGVTCDGCRKVFQIRNQAEPQRGGELQFFVCPHCGRRYQYAFVTVEGVRLRELLESLRRLRRQRDSDKLRSLYERTLAAYREEVQSRLEPAAGPAAGPPAGPPDTPHS